MGIEMLDYLWQKSVEAIYFLGQISTLLSTLSSNFDSLGLDTLRSSLVSANSSIDSAITAIGNNDAATATDTLNSLKDSISTNITNIDSGRALIGASKTAIATGETTIESLNSVVVDDLQPMITTAKRAQIGTLDRTYSYVCDKCSARCPLNLPFQPTDASFYPKCFNDGKDAHWIPVV